MTPEQICSAALIDLGGQPITTFTQSTIAITAGTLYPLERAKVMRAKPWTFLRLVAKSNKTGTETEGFTLPNRFFFPANFIRLWEVTDMSNCRIEYELGSAGILYARPESIMLTYSHDLAEEFWPDWFNELMVAAMKGRLAYAQTNSRTMTAQCKEEYEYALRTYAGIEATEHEAEEFGRSSDWLGVR